MLETLSILGISLLLLGIAIWTFVRHRRKVRAATSAITSQPPQAPIKSDQAIPQTRTEAAPAAPTPAPAPAPAIRQAEPSLAPAVTANTERVPEDSVLRRHYQAAKLAEKEALANPYPTDSVLRRHYAAAHGAYSAPGRIGENRPTRAEAESCPPPAVAMAAEPGIPQDSVLRRHFLARLANQIESELPVKPSDSVLRRHYEAIVAQKLQQYLARMQSA